jgi:hypothetical protein
MQARTLIPLAVPTENGDKKCGCCNTLYSRDEIKTNGLLKYGAYWANCVNCDSTLTIRVELKTSTEGN